MALGLGTRWSQPEEYGGCESEGGEEDGWAALVAGREAAPIFQAPQRRLHAVRSFVAAVVVLDGHGT